MTAKVAKKRKPGADSEDVPIRTGARCVGLRGCTVVGGWLHATKDCGRERTRNSQSLCSLTPLMIAAEEGHEAVVKLLSRTLYSSATPTRIR